MNVVQECLLELLCLEQHSLVPGCRNGGHVEHKLMEPLHQKAKILQQFRFRIFTGMVMPPTAGISRR